MQHFAQMRLTVSECVSMPFLTCAFPFYSGNPDTQLYHMCNVTKATRAGQYCAGPRMRAIAPVSLHTLFTTTLLAVALKQRKNRFLFRIF